MEIMERIALALEKVEAIKTTEKVVYENLRKDLAIDIKTAINERPKINNNLDPEIVAKHIMPSIVGKLPNTEVEEKRMKEIFENNIDKIERVINQKDVNIDSKNTFLTYFCGFITVICLFFGIMAWHYSAYKENAYKYNFLKKYSIVENFRARNNFYNKVDSVASNDFDFIEKYVDTTDVAEILRYRIEFRERQRVLKMR